MHIQIFINILIIHLQFGFPVTSVFRNNVHPVYITVLRDYKILIHRIETQCELEVLVRHQPQPVKQIIVVNLPEVLPGTPGHLIRRVEINKIIILNTVQNESVITSLEDDTLLIQQFTPIIQGLLQPLWFNTVPGDMKSVVEITVLVVSGNTIGTSPHQKEETIRTPGLVELLPDHLEILLLILPVRNGIHFLPHPGILIKQSVRIPLDCIPQVYQITVYVRTDTPVHIVIFRFKKLEHNGTSPAERFIIGVYEIGEIIDNLFALDPLGPNPFYYWLYIHSIKITKTTRLYLSQTGGKTNIDVRLEMGYFTFLNEVFLSNPWDSRCWTSVRLSTIFGSLMDRR